MRMTAGGEEYLYAMMFNFDRWVSHPIRRRVDRRQPLSAASLCWPRSPHRPMLHVRPCHSRSGFCNLSNYMSATEAGFGILTHLYMPYSYSTHLWDREILVCGKARFNCIDAPGVIRIPPKCICTG